jgi:hypothetical protein
MNLISLAKIIIVLSMSIFYFLDTTHASIINHKKNVLFGIDQLFEKPYINLIKKKK